MKTESTHIGMIELVKLVRQSLPIDSAKDGGSIGAALDATLEEAAMNGEEVQSLTVHITEEAWQGFARKVCESARSYGKAVA